MAREARGSFLTHANYLRAFATLAGYLTSPVVRPATALADQKTKVSVSPSLGWAPRGKPNLTSVRTSLSNAWGTELLLVLSSKYATEDALVRLANNWGVVQAYYATYHAFQAYLVANGEARPQTHSQTQRMFADRWARRPLDMPPWTFAADEGTFCNGPGRPINLGLHQWTACDRANCWDLAGKALASTREEAILDAMRTRREEKRRERKRVWAEEERERIDRGRKPRKEPTFRLPQLTQMDKTDVRRRVRPYTLMDYLYRLRIKTNYEDSLMFTEGPDNASASKLVHLDLVRLTASAVFMHELHVRQLVGLRWMQRLVDDWLRLNYPSGPRLGLALRRELLLAP